MRGGGPNGNFPGFSFVSDSFTLDFLSVSILMQLFLSLFFFTPLHLLLLYFMLTVKTRLVVPPCRGNLHHVLSSLSLLLLLRSEAVLISSHITSLDLCLAGL